MLLSDCGTPLRSKIQSVEDMRRWQQILPLYAEMQIDWANHLNKLLSLGAYDRRLSALPMKYEQLLADTESLLIDQPDGLTAQEYRQLRELTPRLTEICQELASYHIPESLDHGDFHDANIFVNNGCYIFIDWGDTCAAHPFFSILIPPRMMVYRLKIAENAPELIQLRDAYLEPWTRFETRENILTALKLALPLAMISRALTGHHITSNLAKPFRAKYADAVPGWLQEFLTTSQHRE